MRVMSVILLVLSIASAAFAEAPKVSLNVRDATLASVAESLSKQADLQIILDKGVTGTVTAELTDMDLEKVLSVVVGMKELKWQKLYALPDENGKIPLETVKAQIEALNMLQDTPLIVYDPATGKQTVFARVEKPTAEKAIDPTKLGMKPFYLIFKPKPPAEAKKEAKEDPVRKLADLRQQRMDVFLRMTPEEQKAAAEQDMMWMMNLPQDAQIRLMTGMFEAARNMDPALRDQFRQTMRETFREIRRQHGAEPH